MPSKAVVCVSEQRPVSSGDAGAAALASVANRPLLSHALDWLAAGGVSEAAILVSGRLAPEVRAAAAEEAAPGVAVQWVEQPGTDTLGEALAALDDFLCDDPFVLHLADNLARPSLTTLIGNRTVGPREALLVAH